MASGGNVSRGVGKVSQSASHLSCYWFRDISQFNWKFTFVIARIALSIRKLQLCYLVLPRAPHTQQCAMGRGNAIYLQLISIRKGQRY